LRCWKPGDELPCGFWGCWVEDTKENGVDVCGTVGNCRTSGGEGRYRKFNVYRSDLVGSGEVREGGNGVEAGE